MFHLWKLNNCSSKLPKNTSVHFAFHYNDSFGQVFEFSEKKQAACHFLLGSHLKVQINLFRGATGMAVTTHIALSPGLFSHVMVHCILVVSLHSSKTEGKHVFTNLGSGA